MKIKFELTIEVEDSFPRHLSQCILDRLEEALVTDVELLKHNFDVDDQDYEVTEEREY